MKAGDFHKFALAFHVLVEFGHFTMSFCKVLQRSITHVRSTYYQIWFFNDVLVATAIVVSLKHPYSLSSGA